MTELSRIEKSALAQRLREKGLTRAQIAQRLGVTPKTISDWAADPDGSKLRARKERYAGTCKRCGGPTHGGNGPNLAPPHCLACLRELSRLEAQERVVSAIQRYAERYGRPPAATDFNPVQAREHGHDWRAARYYGDGDYPHVNSAQCAFGSWNAALEAAGFPARRAGTYDRLHGQGAHLADERDELERYERA